ncbi:X-Pro dipeptidyl-peptidase-like protein [Stella humosa]|uniref:X-Pro dipeptidyl-peptidase-like protein n=1 Tax=Stella humosa TaxID=94 RepID=A0A3N1LKD6_9PROT|nr:CocE/NonD family hydrolase [Stella humosa]ROP91338.1 X-Pro dipeptidyl-peptidase-like protein [Stella humosa]BBK34305.1 dienelactone hydrolase [Stella humosa]
MPLVRLIGIGRLLLLLALLSAPPAAQAGSEHEGLSEGSLTVPVVLPDGSSVRLAGYLARPPGPGPFPIVLLTHGTPRDPADRTRTRAESAGPQARDFARRGWAALSIVRRGYGTSEGEFVESAGNCGSRDYGAAGLAAAVDLRLAAGWLAAQPWADPRRLLLVGVSTGGLTATALASQPPTGLVGVINFAGGRGSRGPNDVCQPDRLVEAFARYGRTARAPGLWIYAENDLYFGPALSRAMLAAYQGAGAPAEFHLLPPFGADGHSVYGRAPELWWPLVDAFLRRSRLPTWSPTALSPDALPAVTDRLRAAFERYLAGAGEKAFAASATGRFGWATGRASTEAARAAALDFCQGSAGTEAGCRLYFVNLAPAAP